jgi:ATP-dependent Clp protease ATP-binding subunit ClpA
MNDAVKNNSMTPQPAQNLSAVGQIVQPQTTVGSSQGSSVRQADQSDVVGGMGVTKRDVENVVSSWTGIPISKLTEDESAKLLKLEDRIHQRLIDQEEAVLKVAEAVRRGRIGLASGQRPIASFIFLGPSGTGKTELAKTLAEILFGKDDMMVRLDMSEYMEKHEVAKLIGAPPGYVGYEEGGQLTEAVRAKPYSIVLLDEVEKAHPDVFNILLQLLEDGRLTDNKGNTISFKNTIVICTSNIGSGLITEKLGEQDIKAVKTAAQFAKEYTELSALVNNELRKFFRPELLNRFDDIVIFKPLRREDMVGITKLGIEKTAKLLKEQGYSVQITDRALGKLAKEGYDPMYGARPLRRLVQNSVENPVALQIIGKKFVMGDTILIDYNEAKNEFSFEHPGQPSGVSQPPKPEVPVATVQNPQPVSSAAPVMQQSAQTSQQPPVVAATDFDPMSVLGSDTPAQVQVPVGSTTQPIIENNQPLTTVPNGGIQPPPYTGQGMQMSGYANEVPQNFYTRNDEQKVE